MAIHLLLDLDGTLLDTPHYYAWCSAATQLGLRRPSVDDYISKISGRPRWEGAAALLELDRKFGIVTHVRHGLVEALMALKQAEFLRVTSGVELFPDAIRLLKKIKTLRHTVVFYTASRNAPELFVKAAHVAGFSYIAEHEIEVQNEYKGRKDMFRSLCENRSLSQIVLVDDSPYAVEEARSMGISAFNVVRYSARLQRGQVSTLDELDL